MTSDLPDGMSDEQRASIDAANAAREAAERELRELRKTRRELVPLWRRLAEPKADTFGLELEVALIPRGAR